MKIKFVLAVSVLSLGLTAVQAYAETEGAGNPFTHRGQAHSFPVNATTADTGSEAYQGLTGRPAQQPSPMRMVAAGGSEAPVHSVNAMPRGSEEGVVAYIQARSLERYAAANQLLVRVAKVGPAVR